MKNPVHRALKLLGSPASLSAISILSKIAVRAGTFLVVAPLIGPTNQGVIVVTSTWAATVLLIMAYGLQVRVLREMALAKADARAIAISDLSAMAVLSIPSAVAAVATSTFFLSESDVIVFAVLFAATAASVIGDYVGSALRSLGEFRREAAISLGSSILQMSLIIGTALLSDSLVMLAISILFARMVFATLSLICLFYSTERTAAPQQSVPTVLLSGFPYFVDGSLSVLLNGIDILLLSQLVDSASIGHYAVGSRIVQLFLVFPWIATSVIVPNLTKSVDVPSFRTEFYRLARAMSALACGGAAIVLFGGPLLTHWILGELYSDLGKMWPAFAVLILVKFYEATLGIAMTSLGRLSHRAWTQAFAVLCIAALTYALLGKVGVLGVVLAISTTSLLVSTFYQASLISHQIITLKRHVLIALCLFLGMSLAVYWS